MNALQHHAFAHLLAARRRREDGRRRDDIGDRTDGRVMVDASRAPAASSIESLR